MIIIEKGNKIQTNEDVVKVILEIASEDDLFVKELFESIEIKGFSTLDVIRIFSEVVKGLNGSNMIFENEGNIFELEY